MFTGMRAENRSSSEVLDAAALRQQRRLKQAIQFLHRDSADLLPLDGLKKLGTSKQGQPHNILQKRLLEAKLSQGRLDTQPAGLTPNSRGRQTSCWRFSNDDDTEESEEDLIYVTCKCFGQEVPVLIDTGCSINLMSSSTVDTLGLKVLVEENRMNPDGFPFQRRLCSDGCIRELSLNIGGLRIMSSFFIVESTKPLLSLGSKILKSFKCVIDTEKQMLVFGTTTREQVAFVKKPPSESVLDY